MTQAGIYGLPGPTRVKHLRGVATAEDLVNRKFHCPRPNELWVTDITQHRTREDWLYCAAVLDAFSCRIVGWPIDSRADSTLVVNHNRLRHARVADKRQVTPAASVNPYQEALRRRPSCREEPH